MIGHDCAEKYINAYPELECGYDECAGDFVVSDKNGNMFMPPESETDAKFMNRIERSIKAGKNLFFEEWDSFEYPENCEC